MATVIVPAITQAATLMEVTVHALKTAPAAGYFLRSQETESVIVCATYWPVTTMEETVAAAIPALVAG